MELPTRVSCGSYVHIEVFGVFSSKHACSWDEKYAKFPSRAGVTNSQPAGQTRKYHIRMSSGPFYRGLRGWMCPKIKRCTYAVNAAPWAARCPAPRLKYFTVTLSPAALNSADMVQEQRCGRTASECRTLSSAKVVYWCAFDYSSPPTMWRSMA